MGLSESQIEVYSVKEAATILKTSRQQVRKMIQSEELPAVKVGREWRITSDALQEFLEQGEFTE
mgnify:FL=1